MPAVRIDDGKFAVRPPAVRAEMEMRRPAAAGVAREADGGAIGDDGARRHVDAREVAVDRNELGAVRCAVAHLDEQRMDRAIYGRTDKRRLQTGVYEYLSGDGVSWREHQQPTVL